MEELRSANQALQERLDSAYRSMSMSPNHAQLSLFNEMENSDSERSLNNSRRPFSQVDEDDEVEVDHSPEDTLSALETKQVE